MLVIPLINDIYGLQKKLMITHLNLSVYRFLHRDDERPFPVPLTPLLLFAQLLPLHQGAESLPSDFNDKSLTESNGQQSGSEQKHQKQLRLKCFCTKQLFSQALTYLFMRTVLSDHIGQARGMRLSTLIVVCRTIGKISVYEWISMWKIAQDHMANYCQSWKYYPELLIPNYVLCAGWPSESCPGVGGNVFSWINNEWKDRNKWSV